MYNFTRRGYFNKPSCGKQSKNIEITTSTGKTYKGKVIALLRDKNDLALVKIEPKEPLQTVKFGNSENIRVGEEVLAIGNPFGFRGTLTIGIISRIDYQRKKIQTDAAINPGCSGGPLINLNGEVIGINQSIYNPDNNRSNIGIGFAVPVNYAKDFIAAVKNKKLFLINFYITKGIYNVFKSFIWNIFKVCIFTIGFQTFLANNKLAFLQYTCQKGRLLYI